MSLPVVTQNLGNVRASLGAGDQGRALADGLFANFGTKLFHCNACPVTNEFAAQCIDRRKQYVSNASVSSPKDWVSAAMGIGEMPRVNAGISQVYEYAVAPFVFTELLTGGPANDWNTSAIVVQTGRFFHTGRIWNVVRFRQRL